MYVITKMYSLNVIFTNYVKRSTNILVRCCADKIGDKRFVYRI